MKRRLFNVLLVALLVCAAFPASAAKNKEDAARQAARQENGKVLSVKEKRQNKNAEYNVKVLTREGVVKTVRVPKDEKKDKN